MIGKRWGWRIFAALALLSGSGWMPVQVSASVQSPRQPLQQAPVAPPEQRVVYPERHDLSPALSSQRPPQTGKPEPANPALVVVPNRLPIGRAGQALQAPSTPSLDTAVQNFIGPGLMPTPDFNFEGLSNAQNPHPLLPPDTQGDIGPNYYVQWVNGIFAVWQINRSVHTATMVYGPVPGNTLWQGFGGVCETNNDGDIITLYDPLADRWFMSQFALGSVHHQCIAVSQSPNPLGAWYRYDYAWGALMNDYPKFGVWPDGYYMSVNQFDSNDKWAGAGVAVFEREKMLQGQAARMVSFDLFTVDPNLGGLLPSDMDGPPPPSGSPNVFAAVDDNAAGYSSDQLEFWSFHADWQNTANAAFTKSAVINLTALGAGFDGAICGDLSMKCIPQPGTGVLLDAISDRLMYRLQYRNFGSYASFTLVHTVDALSAPSTSTGQAGLRWYEVRLQGGSFSLHQYGTYAPNDGIHRWMPSIAMDRQGDIGLGFSVSSSSVYPSIRYTGRLVGDPLGVMNQGEKTIQAGSGSQTFYNGRWGDYSMMAVDPVDDCTFWYTQEYYQTTSVSDWQTRVASFRFPACLNAPMGVLSGVATDSVTHAPLQGVMVQAGAYTTWTDAAGAFRFAFLPAGTYTVDASLFAYVPASNTGVAVQAGSVTTQNFALHPAQQITVQGKVYDGTPLGHTWPLYARLDISGYPGGPVYTNLLDGAYSVRLPEGFPVDFTVTALIPGYLPQVRTVTPAAGGPSEDFSLLIDSVTCTAPGYQKTGFYQGFDSSVFPADWTVIDQTGNGVVWNFAKTWGDANWTGGPENAAEASSDALGGVSFDTELVSPVLLVASQAGLVLTYLANYQNYAGRDFLNLDINVDNSGWVNLLSWNQDHGGLHALPGELVSVDLSTRLATATSFQLRWHYYDPNPPAPGWAGDWYAQVDEIRLAGPCASLPGGLVEGYVSDANTLQRLNGAQVSGPAGSASSGGVADGYYVLFSPSGTQSFTTSMTGGYGPSTQTASVAADSVVMLSFTLLAPRVEVTPANYLFQLLPGQTTQKPLLFRNTGSLDTTLKIFEVNAPYRPPQALGPFAPHGRSVSLGALGDLNGTKIYYTQPLAPAILSAGGVLASWPVPISFGWGLGFNSDAGDLWLSSPVNGGGDNLDHRVTTSGALTADTIDIGSWVFSWAADMTFDPFTGKLWQVNVGGNNCIYELDPVAKVSTGNRLCPGFGTSQRGLAYNPLDDTFYSGSWNDGIINHFDSRGVLLDSQLLNIAISGLAFNPATRHLFVLSNAPGDPTGNDVYVLDTANQDAIIGAFDIGGTYTHRAGGGLEMDCSGALWALNTTDQKVYRVNSGETGACNYRNIPWLTLSAQQGSLLAGGQFNLNLGFDWAGLPPGFYRTYLRVENGSPYGPVFIPLDLEAGYQMLLILMFKNAGP